MSSHYENVQRRIRQLRRKSWKWVKHAPSEPQMMCAIADYSAFKQALDSATTEEVNKWVRQWSNGQFASIIDYNDSPKGAQSVDDVIVVLEKFAADLS